MLYEVITPALGIAEDPATGSAVAAFSGFLAKLPKYQNGVFSFTIEQGFEMGRPSILEMSFESKMSNVITSYSIHYTKLYDFICCFLSNPY